MGLVRSTMRLRLGAVVGVLAAAGVLEVVGAATRRGPLKLACACTDLVKAAACLSRDMVGGWWGVVGSGVVRFEVRWVVMVVVVEVGGWS